MKPWEKRKFKHSHLMVISLQWLFAHCATYSPSYNPRIVKYIAASVNTLFWLSGASNGHKHPRPWYWCTLRYWHNSDGGTHVNSRMGLWQQWKVDNSWRSWPYTSSVGLVSFSPGHRTWCSRRSTSRHHVTISHARLGKSRMIAARSFWAS